MTRKPSAEETQPANRNVESAEHLCEMTTARQLNASATLFVAKWGFCTADIEPEGAPFPSIQE